MYICDMEKNLKHTKNNLLSQSYCEGIQKLSKNEDVIPPDFQLPIHTIKQRKKSWKKLLAKYSSMESKIEVNIYSLQPKMDLNSLQPIKRRQPMRKSMSMVQYWVNTGNQPYMEDCNKIHSDSGSSLAEEEHLNSVKDMNFSGPKKHLEINEISGDKCFNSSSISSTVDTAAYILANNNTTKKSDIVAIVEGSKINNKEDFCAINSPKSINATNNCSVNQNLSIDQTVIIPQELTQEKINDSALQNNDLIYTNTIPENVNVIKKSTLEEANNFQSLFSDSDEPIIKDKKDNNFESRNSQIDESQTRYSSFVTPSKRKKLYNYTESLAEFTPVSEDNLSNRIAVVKLQRCQHPALNTPLHLSKRQKLKFKRKKKQYSHSGHENRSKLIECTQNDSSSSSLNNSHTRKSDFACKKKSEIEYINSCDKSNENCNDSKTLQSSFDKSLSTNIKYNHFSNNTTNFLCKKFNLKPVIIPIYRLPYVYSESELKSKLNSVEAKPIKNKSQKQKQISEEQVKTLQKSYTSDDNKSTAISIPVSDTEDPFTSMIDDLFLNSTKNKQSCFKTHPQIESDQKLKNYEPIISKKLSNNHTQYENYLNNTKETLVINSESQKNDVKVKTIHNKSKEQNKKSNSIRHSKYVIALSSSDESQSSVTSKHLKYKSKKMSKNIKRISVNHKPNKKRYLKQKHTVHQPITPSSSDEDLSVPKIKKTKCNIKKKNRELDVYQCNSTSSEEDNVQPAVIKDQQCNDFLHNSNDQEENSNKSSSISLNKNGRVEKSVYSSFEDLTTFIIKCNNIKHIEDQIDQMKSKLIEAMSKDNLQQTENKKLYSNLDNEKDEQKTISSLSKRLSENSDRKSIKRPLKDKRGSHRKIIKQNGFSNLIESKGSEILTSSDEECIIPIKKKIVKSCDNTYNKCMNLNFEELMLQDIKS